MIKCPRFAINNLITMKEKDTEDELMFAKVLAGEEDFSKLNASSAEEKAEKQLKRLYVFFSGLFGGILAAGINQIIEASFAFGWHWFNLSGALGAAIAALIYFWFLEKKGASKLRLFSSLLFSLILFATLSFAVIPFLALFIICIIGSCRL